MGELTDFHLCVGATVARGVSNEDDLCKVFSGVGERYSERTEDALYELVLAGLLTWHDGETRRLPGGRRESVLRYEPTGSLLELLEARRG